jgi:hypothetical protein
MVMERSSSAAKVPAVVKTKRGFNIIKQKHQGLAFVNSSSVNEKSQTWSEFSKPLPPKMKFVAQKNVAGNKRRRSRVVLRPGKDSDSDEVLSQASSTRKQYATRRPPSRTTQGGLLGSGAAPPELGRRDQRAGNQQYPVVDDAQTEESLWDFFESYDLEQFNLQLERSSIDPVGDEANWLLPNWAMNILPNGPSAESKLFMHAYATLCPDRTFRSDALVDTNSSRVEPSREEIDPHSAPGISTMECAQALSTLYKQFKTGAQDEHHISFHYGGLCSLVGRLLNSQHQTKATEAAKARCISLLAILAVSLFSFSAKCTPFVRFPALTLLSSRAC